MPTKLVYLLLLIPIPFRLQATDPTKTIESSHRGYDDRGIFYSAKAENLIKNGGFESMASSWFLGKYNGCSATFSTDSVDNQFDGNYAIVETSGSPARKHEDIQLFNFLEISENTSYHITFKASVQKECLISVTFSNGIEIFHEIPLVLQPGKAEYGPFIYKSGISESFTYFSINLGKTETIIALDDLTIKADYTEKEFQEIIASSGFNIMSTSSELHLSLPTPAKSDYPFVVLDEKGQIQKAHKILEGSQDAVLKFNHTMAAGQYRVRIFSPDKTLTHEFRIE